MIVVQNCLVLSLLAESYNNVDAIPMIYWNVPYYDILTTVENLKNPSTLKYKILEVEFNSSS